MKNSYRFFNSYSGIFSALILALYVLICITTTLGLTGASFNIAHEDLVYSPPSWQHWFGTDVFGRDVMARALHGTVTAFSIGFFAASISTIIGTTLGALAGYFGGWIDEIIQWIYTTLDSIPYILLLAAFAFALGQGITNVYLALGMTGWVHLCRLVRGEVLKKKNLEYVQAATVLGASHWTKLLKHILPNIAPIILIQFALSFVAAIKIEVILSYLGLGVETGTPSWGAMIDDAKVELARGIWWNLLAATALMFGLVLSITLFVEHVRNNLDPQNKKANR